MSSQVAGFGKVPTLGDFLHVRAYDEPIPAFEQFLTDGLAIAGDRYGSAFAAAYDAGQPLAFVFRAPKSNGRVVVGLFRPSRDAVGRKFPLCVCVPLDARGFAHLPHLLPLLLGDFLESATAASFGADQVRSQAELEAWLARVMPPRLDEIEGAHGEYHQWASTTPHQTAFGIVYPQGGAGPLHAVSTILGCVEGFRGREQPDTPLSFRFPLGAGGPAAAAFWLDLVRSAARWRGTVPTSFWSFDGMTGVLRMQLGDPPSATVGELYRPDPDSDHCCDLTVSPQTDPRTIAASMPAHVVAALQRPDVTVAQLAQVLAQ